MLEISLLLSRLSKAFSSSSMLDFPTAAASESAGLIRNRVRLRALCWYLIRVHRAGSREMAEDAGNQLLSFRIVIILHIVGILIMIIGSEASNSWTASLTEADLGRVKDLLADVSSSPLTIVVIGVIPVLIRIALFLRQPEKENVNNDRKTK
jgi:hypothetical protein